MKAGLAVAHGIMDNHGDSGTVRSQRGESTVERFAHVRGPVLATQTLIMARILLIDDDDWAEHERYEAHERAVKRMLERTGTAAAPWTAIEADDRRFAFHRVYATLIDAYERALQPRSEAP